MLIFKEIAALRAFLKQKRASGTTVGLVPTMGALHTGHLSLIKTSKQTTSLTVCSLFVNPTQFNNPADLEKYPRTLETDINLLENEHCDILFSPSAKEMYSQKAEIKFDFGYLDKILEGEFRPGHFSGVALIVSKLFNIIQPEIAFFGQKDFQQVKIIERLVADLNFNVEIKTMPIIREKEGLAMSSRNIRLSLDERQKALIFYETLVFAKKELLEGKDVKTVKQLVAEKFSAIKNVQLEYFEVADKTNLKIQDHVTDNNVLLIAGYVGEVRLIDNMLLNE